MENSVSVLPALFLAGPDSSSREIRLVQSTERV
jgi:hypothetical protein